MKILYSHSQNNYLFLNEDDYPNEVTIKGYKEVGTDHVGMKDWIKMKVLSGVDTDSLIKVSDEMGIDMDIDAVMKEKAEVIKTKHEQVKANRKTAGDKVLQKLGISDQEFFDLFGFWINEPTE